MKVRYCKFIGCPRLLTAATARGEQPYGMCNQQMPDEQPHWSTCQSVSREKCQELRRELKARREVQG